MAVWGCGRDTVAGPDPGGTLTPSAHHSPAPDPPPPSLNGEFAQGAGRYTQRGDCRTDGPVTIYFAVEGTAAGPYTGTFWEGGRIVMYFQGPAHFRTPIPDRVTLDAVFVIRSPAGLVTGTKSDVFDVGLIALCIEGRVVSRDTPFTGGPLRIRARYTATIRTASGTFRDQGDTQVEPTLLNGLAFVDQIFISPNVTATPVDRDGDDDDGDDDRD